MPVLTEIVIIFGLSLTVLFVCHRLRVPAIVGYLVTGALAGPQGLGFIKAVHEVETMAEIGVVMLLFSIGIEFSMKNLLRIKRAVLLGGSLQVLLTLGASFAVAREFGQPAGRSVFIGFLVCLSSTAIVLKLLQERAEIDSPHGRTTIGILIFQDIIIVPMLLLTPLLAGKTGSPGSSLLILLLKGVGVIFLVVLSARWVVPQLLFQIARTRSRELFLLGIIVICLGVAWLTYKIGLSLAFGAFLAGLIISESEYSHQAFSNILPLRDIFTSFFFVSIGMLLNVGFLFQHPGTIAVEAGGVLVVKVVMGAMAILFLGLPLRTSILGGMALAQIGEFSFVLSRQGVGYGLLPGDLYQFFLDVSVLTMAATPFILAASSPVADFFSRMPLPGRLKRGLYPVPGMAEMNEAIHLDNHLIIIGFGVNGRNVARAARFSGIPYVVVELNPETVRTERGKGENIYYGDATQEAVLANAHIREARILVIVIPDAAATRRITALARRLNPDVHIITRTRFVEEVDPLYHLGADEVIPEEFETSVEIFSRVLGKYLVPKNEIGRLVAEVRADCYGLLRSPSRDTVSYSDLKSHIPDVEISTFRVNEESPVVGKTLSQIRLRKDYGVTLLAIRRDNQVRANPGGETKIHANDLLIVLGDPASVSGLGILFSGQQTNDQ